MQQSAIATSKPSAASTSCSAPLLVLAEDDDELRALLAGALRHAGYNVTELNNGSQLLRTLVTTNLSAGPSDIALVISDIRMPGVSGLDALAGINWANWTIPVVLMTAFGDRETHAAAKQLGAVAVIDKPFELDELLELVARLLPSDDKGESSDSPT